MASVVPSPLVATPGVVGEFALPATVAHYLEAPTPRTQARQIAVGHQSVLQLTNLLTPAACAHLIQAIPASAWVPVGDNGRAPEFCAATDHVGSWRASAFCPQAAAAVWQRLSPFLPDVLGASDLPGVSFRPAGVSDLWRFISYRPDGQLVVHYDAPYIFDARRRTIASIVLYLDVQDGAGTRFVQDTQENLPVAQRCLDDWDRPAHPSEVICSIPASAGDGLIFDHRILHDSPPLCAGQKLVARTDLIGVQMDAADQ